MSKNILLTGAAGRIETAFRKMTGDQYQLRLGVHNLSKLDDPEGHEVMELEVSDLSSCQISGVNLNYSERWISGDSGKGTFFNHPVVNQPGRVAEIAVCRLYD